MPPAACQVALVYPSTYRVGMSSLGFQMVYRWVNSHPSSLAERFFCEGQPALSVENQRALDQFDLVAFSVAYELDYVEIVRFLLKNGIAPRAAERDPRVEPVILVGGVCLLVNRLPIYDLADILVLGDGEKVAEAILNRWAESGGERKRFVASVAGIEGVEVTAGARERFGLDVGPSDTAAKCRDGRPGAIRPNVLAPLDSADAMSAIVTPNTEFADRCLVEISRGCPYRCAFCFYGHSGPYRVRSFETVREMIERGRSLTNKFGLIAGAVGKHPDIERICQWCLDEGLNVSFSSLRVEDVTPAMLDLLVSSGQRSVTIAPEAGSERLRRRIGKSLPDEQVIEFAAQAAERGLTDLRIYFMVGLPDEQAADIDAIARLVERVRRAAEGSRRTGGRIAVAVNVAVYVPKPGTPLASRETPPASEVKKRLKRLGALLRATKGVAYRPPSLQLAQAQRSLAWGDRTMLAALIEAARTERGWRRILSCAARTD